MLIILSECQNFNGKNIIKNRADALPFTLLWKNTYNKPKIKKRGNYYEYVLFFGLRMQKSAVHFLWILQKPVQGRPAGEGFAYFARAARHGGYDNSGQPCFLLYRNGAGFQRFSVQNYYGQNVLKSSVFWINFISLIKKPRFSRKNEAFRIIIRVSAA